jgi:hypothetical protein
MAITVQTFPQYHFLQKSRRSHAYEASPVGQLAGPPDRDSTTTYDWIWDDMGIFTKDDG